MKWLRISEAIDLRHCWHTNSVRSGVHPAIADAILGHGDKKTSLQRLYMTISDDDLVRAIDMMSFDTGDTETWVQKQNLAKGFARQRGPLGALGECAQQAIHAVSLSLPEADDEDYSPRDSL